MENRESRTQNAEEPLPTVLNGKFFKVLSRDGNKVTATCTICPANKKPINGFVTVTSNFVTHLKRIHANVHPEYIKLKEEEAPTLKKKKESFARANDRKQSNQRSLEALLPPPKKIISKHEKLIAKFLIKGMHPLSTVEQPEFVELITGLNPDAVMSRRTLGRRIDDLYENMIINVKNKLSKVNYLCGTADIWTCSGKSRSFLGITMHWISDDLKRESVVLACRRFKGTHSYDKIADLWNNVINQYDIPIHKIMKAVTDNASNFGKAFQQYQLQEKLNSSDDEDDAEDGVEFIDVMSIPGFTQNNVDIDQDELDQSQLQLPPHQRCASHTLSLVCVTDTTGAFSKNLNSALGKCYGIWNKVGRSSKMAEKIKELCGKQFIKPTSTRWNSLYDSITSLLQQRENLKSVSNALGVPEFREVELLSLKEYCECTKPVAQGLDRLQGEHGCFFGELLPTLLTIQKKLVSLLQEYPNSNKLTNALLNGFRRRFKAYLELSSECSDAILAAVSHPYFKLRWVPIEKLEYVKSLFIEKICKEKFITDNCGASDNDFNDATKKKLDKDDKFFEYDDDNSSASTGISTQTLENKIKLECFQYFDENDKVISSITKYRYVKLMFIKYNTPLPSSGPVERMFNFSGMILSPRRRLLCDENCERLTLLKCNNYW